jgi:hypothetical protein
VVRACLRRSPCPVVVISAELEAAATPMPAVAAAAGVATRSDVPVGV